MNRSLPLLFAAALAGCPSTSDDPGNTSEEDYAEGVVAASWAADMTVEVDGDTLMLADDGLPDHDILEAYALMDNGSTGVVADAYSVSIPLNPVLADAPTDTNMGTIGYMVSGGQLFNPYEGNGDYALENNFTVDSMPFIDSCNGHPLPTGATYHYHGIPYCITDALDQAGEHSKLVGVLLDGFPVYGPQGDGGDAPEDLDSCNGHTGATPEFPDGIYHYHFTEDAPYSIPCFAGEVDIDTTGGPGGPGGPM